MYNRKLVFSAACMGMLVFGIVMTTIGALLPMLIPKFQIDKIEAGSMMSLLSIGILIGSLMFGPIADRFGYKLILIFATASIVIGLESIALTSSFVVLQAALFVIGVGGGILNGSTNALVADTSESNKSARLSLLGVFFGIGAIGIPFVLGLLLEYISYESFMTVIGAAVLIPLIFFVRTTFPSPKQAQGFPVKESLKLIRNLTLLLLGFILFFQSGMEITIGSWTTTFLTEDLSVSENRAVFFLSFYWIGLTLARLGLGAALKKIDSGVVLMCSLIVTFCGIMILINASTLTTAVIALVLIGIGFAAVFPVILGFAGSLFANLSGTAFSILFVIALIGGSLLPLLTGILAETYTLRFGLGIIPVSLVLIFLIFIAIKGKLTHR